MDVIIGHQSIGNGHAAAVMRAPPPNQKRLHRQAKQKNMVQLNKMTPRKLF